MLLVSNSIQGIIPYVFGYVIDLAVKNQTLWLVVCSLPLSLSLPLSPSLSLCPPLSPFLTLESLNSFVFLIVKR